MFVSIWEFKVRAGSEAEFEHHYGPEGTWVQLFRRSDQFRGTWLLHDRHDPQRYLTLDHWTDEAAYKAFRSEFSDEYASIDEQTESLTESETPLGRFDAV